MPYYSAGDYYRGDYYRGDNYAAGGLFSSIIKGVGKLAGGVLKATPVGGIVSSFIPSFGKPRIAPASGFAAAPSIVPVPGIKGGLQRLLPGGESGYMYAKRRRINPLNIKALRRAMRRAKGFERAARRVGSFFSPGKSYRLKGRKRRSS